MKLAFCLYRYFPFGGLQRDFLRIARACVQRGHTVDVYTGSWEGELEAGLNINILPVRGWQNHSRCASFSKLLAQALKQQSYDLVVGFNKMPGLDIYYAADVCYQSRIKHQKPFWYTWLPRYHQYLRDERAVFARDAHTQILVISQMQSDEYRACYQLPRERFHLLPPGISPDRMAPPHADVIRAELRKELQVKDGEEILLMVGSGFKTKGLDRVLAAMAALPTELKTKTRLWVVGQDNPARFIKQAQSLNLSDRIEFLGGRHDVARFFLAADFLVHPAYHENTGTVLLEALVAGLPVLTLDVCGYAHFVEEADAGLVLNSPFKQENFNQALANLLLSPARAQWKKNALTFAKTADIYSLPEKAADQIEATVSFPCRRDSIPQVATGQTFNHYMQLQGQSFRALEGRRTQRVLINNQPHFIKQHFGVGWKEIFKNLLQFKLPILSAKNEWLALERLQNLGVLTPSVKAYGSRGLNPARRQSFILMEEVAPSISLEDFCRHWKTQAPEFKLKQALIRRVAAIAKTMHENGINHRDFYLCHFLLDLKALEAGEPEPRLYLIDLHRAGIHPPLAKRWLVKDLSGLYFSSKDLGLSKRDYLRFIKHYRQKDWRDSIIKEMHFWRQVTTRGEKLYHAHAQPE